jgi:phosphoribosylformimino-5-aminoimidazole carboxamide ribotide isomerase
MRLIPAIDLRGGRCVRLWQGRFDRETVYSDDARELLRRYTGLGARHIHVVDLDGARSGVAANREIVRGLIAEGTATVQVGGGIRTVEAAREWLDTGARIVVGSVATEQPEVVAGWLAEFGGERVILALDVRIDDSGTPRVTSRGWEVDTGRTLWDLVERYSSAGLRHVLCTDVSRDGALAGPNVALYTEAVRRHPSIAWQASGGVSGIADLTALAATGVASVVSGRALLEERLTGEEIEPFLRSA